MALAISVTSRCRGCIAYHVHDALKAGATRQEVLETIGVAIFMGGGPSMVYGCEALDALEQLEAADSGQSQKKET
jgi:AhpD family alkylhydroperoxidase